MFGFPDSLPIFYSWQRRVDDIHVSNAQSGLVRAPFPVADNVTHLHLPDNVQSLHDVSKNHVAPVKPVKKKR